MGAAREDISPRRFRIGLGLLVAMWASMVTAVLLGFPPTSHRGWFYEPRDDEEGYFQLAYSLAHGHPERSWSTVGYPLFLVPFIWLTQATSLDELIVPVGWVQAYLLGSMCLIGVALLGWRFGGKKSVGLLAAGLWTILPYLVYGSLTWLRTTYPEQHYSYEPARHMAYLLGLPLMSDMVGLALVLATLWMLLRSFDTRTMWRYSFTGLLASAAILVRSANVALGGLCLISYLWQRRWIGGIAFLVTAGLGVIPQLWLNAAVEGSPFEFHLLASEQRYFSEALKTAFLRFPYPAIYAMANVVYFWQWILLRLPVGVLVIMGVLLLTVILAVARLFQQGQRLEAGVLCLLMLTYSAVFLPNYEFPNAVIRRLMPLYPGVCIAVAVVLGVLIQRVKRVGESR